MSPRDRPRMTTNHSQIRWNPTNHEWYCTSCGRTSDHVAMPDACFELEQYECRLPVAELHAERRE